MMMCVAYYCYIIPQDKENTVSPMQVNYSLFIELTQLRPGPWVAMMIVSHPKRWKRGEMLGDSPN